MANLNKIILVGRLTAEPETRDTVEGLPVARFNLAVNRTAGDQQAGVDFIDIVAWQQLAETCGQRLKKGSLALVEGRIQNRSFEDQSGQRKWVTEVVAKNVTMLDHQPSVDNKQKTGDSGQKTDFIDDGELVGDLPF